MPGNDWYAPSLTAASEASVADWSRAEMTAWFKTGATSKASALGPMAEVIFQSTQYGSNADLLAMATYLKALPSVEPSRASSAPSKLITQTRSDGVGAKLYAKHCASCHGENGEGKADAFPALAGNRAVSMANATNVISIIIKGGFAPASARHATVLPPVERHRHRASRNAHSQQLEQRGLSGDRARYGEVSERVARAVGDAFCKRLVPRWIKNRSSRNPYKSYNFLLKTLFSWGIASI